VKATPLPVNGDFLNGYADEPESVAEKREAVHRHRSRRIVYEDNTAVPIHRFTKRI